MRTSATRKGGKPIGTDVPVETNRASPLGFTRRRFYSAAAATGSPRSWTERAYHNLIYYNQVDGGGHYAAWEEPQLFAAELRAAFRSLR